MVCLTCLDMKSNKFNYPIHWPLFSLDVMRRILSRSWYLSRRIRTCISLWSAGGWVQDPMFSFCYQGLSEMLVLHCANTLSASAMRELSLSSTLFSPETDWLIYVVLELNLLESAWLKFLISWRISGCPPLRCSCASAIFQTTNPGNSSLYSRDFLTFWI